MKAGVQFRRGINKAIENTAISSRQASLAAGFNENQLNRFLSGKNDILLETLDEICREGFGLPLDTVFRMGK